MGKRRKGSNKMGSSIPLENAADSDNDLAVGKSHFDAMDRAEDDEEIDLRRELRSAGASRSSRYISRGREDAALDISASDSDDDLTLPKLPKRDKKKKKKGKAEDEDELNYDSDLDQVEERPYEDELVGAESWGSKKKHYYGGNPNERFDRKGKKARDGLSDDELSENEIEGIEAEKLQIKQLEAMDEEDFLDAFAVPEKDKKKGKKTPDETTENVKLDLSKLSRKEKAKMFARESPEFAGIMADFDAKMAEAEEKLAPIVAYIDEGKIPSGPAADFVKTKYQVTLNYCTNIAAYIMFKTKRAPLKLHPLTGRIVQYKQMLDQMAPLEEKVMFQVDQILAKVKKGERIETQVKRAKKRVLSKEKKAIPSQKRLRILEKPSEAEKEDKAKKPASNGQGQLTMDERMALEIYDAMRGKKDKKKKAEADESSDEEEGPIQTENGGQESKPETEEERRAITYQIAKNKGLTPKRSKLQRNPRVKNRKKFDKAKVRRKGQVREVRTEVKKYAGEFSGINARVKKGIKLG